MLSLRSALPIVATMTVTVDLTEEFRWEGRTIRWGRTGAGPAVVFCHGTPWSSVVWQAYAQELGADHTVYLWDMPGFGRSSKQPDHRVDFDVQARVFAALLAHWGLDGTDAAPHVVAHDYGGIVSLRAHLVEGARYMSLLLTDVVAIPPAGSPFFRFVQDNPDLLAGLPGYIHTAVVHEYIRGAGHRDLSDADLAALVEPWVGAQGQPAFYRQIAQFDVKYLEDIESRLGGIDIPVHVVWGRQDTWIPLSTGQRLHSLIPGATLRTVDGAGHLIQYDAPVALTGEIRRWLAAQPPVAPSGDRGGAHAG